MLRGRSIATLACALIVLWFSGMSVFILHAPILSWSHQKTKLTTVVDDKSKDLREIAQDLKFLKAMLQGQQASLKTLATKVTRIEGGLEHDRDEAFRTSRNARPTIFVSIASYRDLECNTTVLPFVGVSGRQEGGGRRRVATGRVVVIRARACSEPGARVDMSPRPSRST